jgi:hypothetical protein
VQRNNQQKTKSVSYLDEITLYNNQQGCQAADKNTKSAITT